MPPSASFLSYTAFPQLFFHLVKPRTTVTMVLGTLGAVLPRLVIVLAAVVRVYSGCVVVAAIAAWQWTWLSVATIAVTVTGAVTTAGAVTATFAKELFLVKDTAALADLLVLWISHLRIPGDMHGPLPLGLLRLGRGGGSA